MALIKHTILFFALAALLTFALALPVAFPSSQVLEARLKIGPAKPRPVAPRPARPPPAKAPPALKRPPPPPKSVCNGLKDKNGNGNCDACVKNSACAFDRNGLKCVPKPAGALGASFVTTSTQCRTIRQTTNINPNADVQKQAAAEFARMEKHIFQGETDPTSGRHTFSAWTAKNKDAGICDKNTHLCAFRLNEKTPKTVWDDRSGAYTKQDIKDMCLNAITLNIQKNNNAKSSAAFVVQTKFGKPICIEHLVTKANTPSCFPLGIHSTFPGSRPLGSSCSDTGHGAIKGVTEDIAARK